jgi:hypothetical protein
MGLETLGEELRQEIIERFERRIRTAGDWHVIGRARGSEAPCCENRGRGEELASRGHWKPAELCIDEPEA